jgi:NAD(P)-dependent dehydrogenase (short-subunit alcohol dehydrogenase family)
MRKMAYPLEDPKNLLKPEDVIEKYVWLMSEESSKIDGQTINCQ